MRIAKRADRRPTLNGPKLKAARVARKMSVVELAGLLKFSRQRLYQIEAAPRTVLNPLVTQAFADVLKVDIEEITNAAPVRLNV